MYKSDADIENNVKFEKHFIAHVVKLVDTPS
jgi:hypothetical protein